VEKEVTFMVGGIGASNRYIIPTANVSYVTPINTDNTVESSARVEKPKECQTCKNRKYQDGSNEMVSYKTPGNIKPGESYGKVMAHEQEHVTNAIAEGSQDNKELVSATVSLKTAVCPECGRTYIAGGTTRTVMRTYNDDPYSQNQKAYEAEATRGNNIDYVA
jgi:deoxycytidylate deaminase